MTNWKKVSIWTVCLFVGVAMLVSCGAQPKDTENAKEYTFDKCVLTVKMELPDGWTSSAKPTYSGKNPLVGIIFIALT